MFGTKVQIAPRQGVALIINLDVPDVATGVLFYTTGLEFALRRFLFGRKVAELRGAGGTLFLIEQPAGSIAVPGTAIARNYSDHWTPVHLDISVIDLDAAVARARNAGAIASGPATVHAFGRLAMMRDPFGHGFCLIEFSDAGYDSVALE